MLGQVVCETARMRLADEGGSGDFIDAGTLASPLRCTYIQYVRVRQRGEANAGLITDASEAEEVQYLLHRKRQWVAQPPA